MRNVSRGLVCGVSLTVALAVVPVGVAQDVPVPVSPGSPDAFTPVGSSCPTFSWGAVDEVRGYELVVYASPGEVGSLAAEPAGEPAIRARIPGRALSWTPPAGACLALAGDYAWSVRALGEEERGDWSQPSLFRVEPAVAVADLAAVMERALVRYLESRGLRLEPDGELARLISEELAGGSRSPAAPDPAPAERHVYSGGKRHVGSGPTAETLGVFTDDIELWLEETGSTAADKVQLVFATPEFDGDPINGDAWAIVVDAFDSGSGDDGTMSFSAPSFVEPLQLFTDGSAALGELRSLVLRRLSSPPFSCTSLQEGSLYWDDDISLLCVCDGSGWDTLDGDATGSCS